MEKKQTAVDMAFEKLAKQGLLVTREYNNLVAYREAKQMEKEQNQLELPSDDDIDDEATNYIENASAYSFVMGAKWMRDKIKGGNNE